METGISRLRYRRRYFGFFKCSAGLRGGKRGKCPGAPRPNHGLYTIVFSPYLCDLYGKRAEKFCSAQTTILVHWCTDRDDRDSSTYNHPGYHNNVCLYASYNTISQMYQHIHVCVSACYVGHAETLTNPLHLYSANQRAADIATPVYCVPTLLPTARQMPPTQGPSQRHSYLLTLTAYTSM